MTASNDVARMEDEIRLMQTKAESDERMIELLRAQTEQLSQQLEQVTSKCTEANHRLTRERDEAIRRETEVRGLLHQAAELILAGMRKIAPEAPQTVPPPNLTQLRKMEPYPPGEPAVDDEDVGGILARLPRNEFASIR